MATQDIARLYDEHIAAHYDENPFGILSGGRDTAAAQIARHAAVVRPVHRLVDLALGTGESVLAVRHLFPGAEVVGLDIADGMLAIARKKLEIRAICDDALNVGRHVEAGSADLVLVHFLTTYVDARAVFREAARILRPGGHLSVVSGTMESFRATQALALRVLPLELLQQLSPAPQTMQSVVELLGAEGFTVREGELMVRPLSLPDFPRFREFGITSGFFTHMFDGVDASMVDAFARLEGAFPLHDEYKAAVILAEKTGIGARS